ncbi:hypothetical protein GPJ81_18720 [Pseudomonas alkylphenolica]|jgi:hypothetical protein|uniref:Uncharacterized protein n=1 Tax=Pseudomonas alkylphenolica TaxID=237609 RepID=A0A6I6H8H5_9PSED|nr:hypothetical protein [Pseudomonas alkylphenolica]QGW78631.1 hypothetical protein GPJ81_18720 [Pseudomonas alkylphenolica]
MGNIEMTKLAWSAPRLREASEDTSNPSGQYLTIDRIYGISGETLICDVSISSGMEAGDIVRVRGQYGGVIYDAPTFRLASPPRNFTIPFPKFMLYGSSGASLNLNFALRRQGAGDWLISQSRLIRIQAQPLEPQAPVLPRGSRRLVIQYTGMASGHTVRARLYSSATQFTDTAEVTVSGGTAYIDIPYSWFVANSGRTVWINYAVNRRGDTRRIFSRLLYIERLEVPSLWRWLSKKLAYFFR